MYNLKFHKDLDLEKWSKFTPTQQILLIANELNRARNWIVRGDTEEVNNCYERAFELLDLTIAMKYRKNLVKELLRAREVLALLNLNNEKNMPLGTSAKEENHIKTLRNFAFFARDIPLHSLQERKNSIRQLTDLFDALLSLKSEKASQPVGG
ncbi:MAG: hypothetical protein ACP5EQ_08275 [Candidatus Cloacimonadia bacterium]